MMIGAERAIKIVKGRKNGDGLRGRERGDGSNIRRQPRNVADGGKTRDECYRVSRVVMYSRTGPCFGVPIKRPPHSLEMYTTVSPAPRPFKNYNFFFFLQKTGL